MVQQVRQPFFMVLVVVLAEALKLLLNTLRYLGAYLPTVATVVPVTTLPTMAAAAAVVAV